MPGATVFGLLIVGLQTESVQKIRINLMQFLFTTPSLLLSPFPFLVHHFYFHFITVFSLSFCAAQIKFSQSLLALQCSGADSMGHVQLTFTNGWEQTRN